MRPSPGLLRLLGLWTLLGLVPVWWGALLGPWLAAGALLLAFAGLDARRVSRQTPVHAERTVNPILPVGVWSRVLLKLHNPNAENLSVSVHDYYPQPAEVADLPQQVQISGAGWTEIRYRLRPVERGEHAFGPIQIVLDSPYRLWQRHLFCDCATPLKVYPNFANIAKFTLLTSHNRVSAMGIHKRRRRGEGQDFFQLREYRPSDSLRQIDWKATSRMKKLISKEYQDERNQTLLFLLDCSRRMRALDNDLSHFDHALNAMILLTYVALRQGDAVGVHSFGGPVRWLAPKPGINALNKLINAVYDLQPTVKPPDYAAAAQRLLTRQRKRALVVILTNLRDEDSNDLLAAIRLLARRHVVLIANLRETVLDQALTHPLGDFPQARLYAATCHYLLARDRCQQQLRQQGGVVLDAAPSDLPAAIVNHYLDLKRSGRI